MGYISRVKTWIAGETLTASDLNAEFDNTLDSQMPIPSGFTQGDILFMGASQPERLAAGTAGYYLTTHGAGADPTWTAGMADPLTTQGDIIVRTASATTRLAAGTAGMALTTGGAGANSAWAGMTTQGDIEYHNGTTRTRLSAGTKGQTLVTGGAGENVSWGGMTTVGDIEYHNGTTRTRLAKGTEGQALVMGASNVPEWGTTKPDATAGNYVEIIDIDAQTTTSNSFTKKFEIKVNRDGAFRIGFHLKQTGGQPAHGRIYRNGVAVGSDLQATGTSYSSKTEDISGWSEGDLCQLYLRVESGGTSAEAQKLYIATSNPLSYGFHVDDVEA